VAELARVVAGLRPVPVLVHGGGKEIGAIQRALGGEPRFVGGLRVTDEYALQAAEMVLCGLVSTRLVVALLAAGADAQGLSGVDRGLIRVERQLHPDGDLGHVGRPVAVRVEVLRALLEQNVLPVLAPISLGSDGVYNVNADEAAGAVARALGAYKVMFLTDVVGWLRDPEDPDSVISEAGADEVEAVLDTVAGGMRPKLRACLDAIHGGVTYAHIVDGRVPHSLLLELFTNAGIGTKIRPAA
jgi:acetylglutamate kinase